MGILVVYFSSVSGNTHRFVENLGVRSARIPLKTKEDTLLIAEPYILVVPTYGGGNGKGAVPKQVIKFLNVAGNREHLKGVIGLGNTNFGDAYGIAADIISAKCDIPVLGRFELFGTNEDIAKVQQRMEQL